MQVSVAGRGSHSFGTQGLPAPVALAAFDNAP
jgi:hypothetical protein